MEFHLRVSAQDRLCIIMGSQLLLLERQPGDLGCTLDTNIRTTRDRSMILIGPGRHFGIELVSTFLDAGFHVGVVCSTDVSAEIFRSKFPLQTERVKVIAADLMNVSRFSSKVADLTNSIPQLECLIYNPKNQLSGNGLTISPNEFSKSVSIDLAGAVAAIQAVLPRLLTAKSGAVIVTGGGFKDRPSESKFSLSVTKAGLHNLVRSISGPLSKLGIRTKTIIIDGAVRRSAKESRSSQTLAKLYLRAFAETNEFEYEFPRDRLKDAEEVYQGILDL